MKFLRGYVCLLVSCLGWFAVAAPTESCVEMLLELGLSMHSPEIQSPKLTTEVEALFETVVDNPKDDAPRLINTDKQEEEGDLARAQYVRLGIKRSREVLTGEEEAEFVRLEEQMNRRYSLLAYYGNTPDLQKLKEIQVAHYEGRLLPGFDNLEKMTEYLDGHEPVDPGPALEWHRGYVYGVTIDVSKIKYADIYLILESLPKTVEKLTIDCEGVNYNEEYQFSVTRILVDDNFKKIKHLSLRSKDFSLIWLEERIHDKLFDDLERLEISSFSDADFVRGMELIAELPNLKQVENLRVYHSYEYNPFDMVDRRSLSYNLFRTQVIQLQNSANIKLKIAAAITFYEISEALIKVHLNMDENRNFSSAVISGFFERMLAEPKYHIELAISGYKVNKTAYEKLKGNSVLQQKIVDNYLKYMPDVEAAASHSEEDIAYNGGVKSDKDSFLWRVHNHFLLDTDKKYLALKAVSEFSALKGNQYEEYHEALSKWFLDSNVSAELKAKYFMAYFGRSKARSMLLDEQNNLAEEHKKAIEEVLNRHSLFLTLASFITNEDDRKVFDLINWEAFLMRDTQYENFQMAATQLTKGIYQLVVKEHHSLSELENNKPLEANSIQNFKKFLKLFNKRAKELHQPTLRIPTLDERLSVLKGYYRESINDVVLYHNVNKIHEYANFDYPDIRIRRHVATLFPNSLGIYDAFGNVSELVSVGNSLGNKEAKLVILGGSNGSSFRDLFYDLSNGHQNHFKASKQFPKPSGVRFVRDTQD